MIATKDHRHDEFMKFLSLAGLPVKFESRELGYVRISAPINDVESVVSNPFVEAAGTVADYPPVFFSAGDGVQPRDSDPPRRLADLLRDSGPSADVFDVEAMRLSSFRRSHPFADGRGVTIALIERFIDPEEPEMAIAKSLDGRRVHKVRAMYEANSYMADRFPNTAARPEFSGVRLSKSSAGSDLRLTISGRRVRVARPGNYQTGVADESSYDEADGDFNKDGNPKTGSRLFSIARRKGEHCFLVDVNQNDDLRDDPCIGDFNAARQTERFPSLTPGKPGTRFWILTTPDPDWIVFATPGFHSHAVANTALGGAVFDRRLSGVAPGAQIISIGAGVPGSGSFLEAFIRAAYDPRVDIIVVASAIMSFRQGGQDVRSIIRDRIVARKNKIIVASAGNTYNTTFINTTAQGLNVLAVGQLHTSKAKLLLAGVNGPDSSSVLSSGGPPIDGRIKPDVVSPSLVITMLPEANDMWRAVSRTVCPRLILPSRAICAHGTSNASAVAAGAIASLLSVMKTQKRHVRALDVVEAIRFSAGLVHDVPVYLQGNGVIDVPRALANLQASAVKRPQFVIDAPVPAELSVATGKPRRGYGLYEREGWHPGSKGVRAITIRRVSGINKVLPYTTRILGDRDQVYRAPPSIQLPLNRSVDVPIAIAPRNHGLHSALLELSEFTSGRVVARINLTTIASLPLGDSLRGPIMFEQVGSNWKSPIMYVDVPEETAALGINVAVPENALLLGFMHFQTPYSMVSEKLSPQRPPPAEARSALQPATQVHRAVLWPTPGVWELAFPVQSVSQRQAAVSGIIFGITDKDVDRTIKGTAHEMINSADPVRLKVKQEPAFYKGGSVRTNGRLMPTLIRVPVPDGAATLEVRAEVRNRGAGERSRVPIALALFSCNNHNCSVVDRAIGRGRTALFNLVSPGAEVFAALLNLGAATSDIDIAYDLYLSNDSKAWRVAGIDSSKLTASAGPRASGPSFCSFDTVYAAQLDKSLAYIDYEGLGLIESPRLILHDRFIAVPLRRSRTGSDCKSRPHQAS